MFCFLLTLFAWGCVDLTHRVDLCNVSKAEADPFFFWFAKLMTKSDEDFLALRLRAVYHIFGLPFLWNGLTSFSYMTDLMLENVDRWSVLYHIRVDWS